MEKSPKKTGQMRMSDLALAQSLFREINKGHPPKVNGMLNRVYEAVKNAHEKRADEKERSKPWTFRKVRGIWENNAIVKYYEMQELAEAAARIKQLEQARKEHAEFIAQNSRIQALLSSIDPSFHSAEIERLRSINSRMGGTGTNRTETDE